MKWRSDLFCKDIKLLFRHDTSPPDFTHDLSLVSYSFYHVTSTCFPFSTNERGAFGYPTKSFSQITRSADKGNFKGMLVDMEFLVGGGENFRFINIINSDGLEDL